MKKDRDMPLILRHPFLDTSQDIIDVKNSNMTLRVNEEEVHLNNHHALKFPEEVLSYMRMYLATPCVHQHIDSMV